MPLGAYGGKEEVMRIFDPRIPEPLSAHGTMNGSPLCLAAGCASLDMLDEPAMRPHQRHSAIACRAGSTTRPTRPASTCGCTTTARCCR